MIFAWLKTAQYWIIGIAFAALLSFCGVQTLRLSSLKTTVAENKAMQERQARELSEKYRAQEAKAIQQSQADYEKYLDEKKAAADANDRLATTAISLRNQLATYKRRLSEASTNPQGAIATGTVGIDVFYECTERYSELAKETGRIADSKNALIDQVKN